MRSYTTKQGDTWDLIAYQEYPDMRGELLTSILIENNSTYIDTVIFPAGAVIALPDMPSPVPADLPPWID